MENDNKEIEEAAETTSDQLTKELLRRRDSGEDCTNVIQAVIDKTAAETATSDEIKQKIKNEQRVVAKNQTISKNQYPEQSQLHHE